MQNLHAICSKSFLICTRVAPSCMQIVPAWPPVACHRNKIDGNLHATGDHAGTICMPLVDTRLQDKRQADKRCAKGRPYIILILFCIGKSTSSKHASDFSADGLWIFGLENVLVLGWNSHTEENLACASGQLHAKPPVFCKHAARTIIWIKKWTRH